MTEKKTLKNERESCAVHTLQTVHQVISVELQNIHK